jgi:hypothetical protein
VPSQLRKLKEVWLLTARRGEDERPLCVTGTFKSVYALALFELRIAEPNLQERAARESFRSNGLVWLWNRAQFDSFEEAMWSPIGQAALIEKIPVKMA